MSTVLTIRNIRIAIYANNHPPPHVHAIRRDGALAKLELNCPGEPVTLVGKPEFCAAEIAAMGRAVAAELTTICAKWRAIHG